MATVVGAGFDISKLLDSITKADKALTNLMDKDNQVSRSIITSFQQIANQGVVPYTQSLEKNLSIYNSIRDSITDTTGKAKRGFGEMKSEIDKVISSTDTLLRTLSQTSQFKDGLGLTIASIRESREMMTRVGYRTDGATWGVSAEDTIKSYQRDMEERRKYITERKAIYERMFDEIERKEKKSIEERTRYEQSKFNESLSKYRKNKEDQAKVDRHYHAQRQKEYEEMFRAIERTQQRERALQNARGDSSKGALNYYNRLYSDRGVMSINNMNTSLQKLRDAQNKLNMNTEEGRKKYAELGVAIKRVENEMRTLSGASDEVKKKHRTLMDTSGQLMRAMAAIFSVSAIKGYINKLREVRGEFEMQQRSLQILLQNQDKANELWEKTITLAVKSPFRVKELVTYTKQLAAYRVESDKLYDTTKMLADVSAGLGVDMNRLILAFGQVKAANFLRGTELRQFTEAGIPMLDELAKLFTELEGRAVSAGDVFERISKRMVTFGDVEEVFHRITSAGGVFYQMQEEQSKTLAGLYSNLHDSIDLMLNDIGKANDGILKGSVNVAKEFVENWREVTVVLAQIVSGLTAYKLSSAAFALGLKNTTNATLRFNNALTWADAKAIGFTKTQFLLTKAMTATKIAANGVKVAFMQIMLPTLIIAGVAKLVQMITKASREAKRLKKDLNAIFEKDTYNLKRQTEVFEDLVERLKDVNTGSKEHNNIISQLNNQYGEYIGFIVDEKTTYDQLASSINNVTTALTQKAKASSYEKTLSRLYEDTDKTMAESASKIEEQFERGFFRANGPKIIPTEDEIQDIFALIQKKVSDTGERVGEGLALGDILSEYYGERIIFSATERQNELLEYSDAILKRREEEAKIQRRINILYGEGVYSTKEYRDEMEKLNRAKNEELSKEKSRSGREKIEYKYKVEEVRLQGKYEGLDDATIQKRIEKIQKVEATVADINRRMSEEVDKFGQDAVDRVYITFQDASQGIDAIAQQTAASYKSMQKEIQDQNALKKAGTVHDQQALVNAELMSRVYYRMLEIMGKTDLIKDDKSDKTKREVNILNNRISLIKEMYEEYKKLNKELSDEDARRDIEKAYKGTFIKAFEGTGISFSGLVIDNNKLEELKQEGKDAGKVFSDAMMAKMQEVVDSGTYIRGLGESFEAVREKLKSDEGFVGYIYSDKDKGEIKTQIATLEDLYKFFDRTGKKKKGTGTLTIGYGHALHTLEEAKRYLGITLSQAEAEELLTKDIRQREGALNRLLDKHSELIITQEQYNVLFNNLYQGGLSAALDRAGQDISKTEKYIRDLDADLRKMGSSFAQEFGEDWLENYKQLPTYAERFAKQLEIASLTTKDMGSHVDPILFGGMKRRSSERAAMFSGDLEVVNLLRKAAVDVSQIDFTNVQGVVNTLRQLMPIAEQEGEEAVLTLSRAISDFEAEIRIQPAVTERELLERQISDIFSNYEISLEMDKLNIPPDLAQRLFGFEAIDLNDIREKVLAKFGLGSMVGTSNQGIYDSEQFKAMSKERQDELRKALEKESEIQDKALKDRMKEYVKYLREEQTERVKIKLEEVRKLKEIDEMNELTLEEKNLMKQNVKKESNAAMAKAEWESFAKSPYIIQLFDDIDTTSTKALSNLHDKLVTLKSDLYNAGLHASELKEVLDKINQVEDELNSRNPFRGWGEGLKNMFGGLRGSRNAYNEQLAKQVAADNLVKQWENDLNTFNEENGEFGGNQAERNRLNDQLRLAIEKAEQLMEEGKGIEEAYHNAQVSVTNFASNLQESINISQELVNSSLDLVDSFGLLSDEQRAVADNSMNILGDIGGLATSAARIASGDVIGGIASAISSTASLITNINKTGDAVKDMDIARQAKNIKRLEKSYENLEKAMDEAYSIEQMKEAQDAMRENINGQIEALERQKAAEESKKNTDQEVVDDYADQIEELEARKAELQKELVEKMGGTYDYSSVAEQFLDAWLTAFNETGDGLSGLEKEFDSFWKDILKKQVIHGGATAIVQNYVDEINNALKSDSEYGSRFSEKEKKAIEDAKREAMSNLNDFYDYMNDQYGLSDIEGAGFTGLQSGIQGMTEEQSDVLAAYWNAVRLDVSDIRSRLEDYMKRMLGDEENPMLSSLQAIAQSASDIHTLLKNVSGASIDGDGIRVIVKNWN